MLPRLIGRPQTYASRSWQARSLSWSVLWSTLIRAVTRGPYLPGGASAGGEATTSVWQARQQMVRSWDARSDNRRPIHLGAAHRAGIGLGVSRGRLAIRVVHRLARHHRVDLLGWQERAGLPRMTGLPTARSAAQDLLA